MTEYELSNKIIGSAIEIHKALGPGLLESAYKEVVIEIKSVEALNDIHLAQTLTYLKLGNFRLGLLINFNVLVLNTGNETPRRKRRGIHPEYPSPVPFPTRREGVQGLGTLNVKPGKHYCDESFLLIG
jgi:hypothetical protein